MYVNKNKNEKYNFLVLLIFLFNLLFDLFNSYDCITDFSDCFNCSICGNNNIDCSCSWNPITSTCNNILEPKNFQNFYEYFSYCNDSESISIQNNYCGSTNLTIKDEYIFEMPKIYGKYGIKSIFCHYTFFLSDIIKNYNINFDFNTEFIDDFNKIHLFLFLIFRNNTLSKIKLDKAKINIDSHDIKNFEFMLYLESSFISFPFNLSIKDIINFSNSSMNNYTVLIVSSVLGFILFIIGVFILTKKLYKIDRENHMSHMDDIISRQLDEGNEEKLKRKKLEKNNKLKIKYALNNYLCPKEYTELYQNYSQSCSICMEAFNIFHKVSITPCKHIFHFNCLSNWLDRNALNPKCPNCNFNLIQEVDKKQIEDIKIVNTHLNENDIINHKYKENKEIISKNKKNKDDNTLNINKRITDEEINKLETQNIQFQE